jgi:hypothetical protein
MNSSDVTAGTNATATHYNNLRKDVVLGIKIIGTDADASTITIDLSDKTKSNVRNITLGGNRTLAISNATTGQAFVIRLIQDGTGSRTVTWFSTIKWPAGVTPTLTTTASKTDVFGFIVTGTGTYDGFIIGQNL